MHDSDHGLKTSRVYRRRFMNSSLTLHIRYPMDSHKIYIGSAVNSKRDIRLLDGSVSRRHCSIKRSPHNDIIVNDCNSSTGTWYADMRKMVFSPNPGDIFTIGNTDLMILDEAMHAQSSAFSEILGTTPDSKADEVISLAVERMTAGQSPHIVIIGRPEDDTERLATTIHATSWRRARPLIEISDHPQKCEDQIKLIKSASNATIMIDLNSDIKRFESTFSSMLSSVCYNIRFIILTPERELVSKILGGMTLSSVYTVEVPVLRVRGDNHLKLLDQMLRSRNAGFCVADLTPRNRHSIISNWPKTIRELRVLVENLIAINNDPEWKRRKWEGRSGRASLLGMAKSTAHTWYTDIGLEDPLI
jgi:hypothetical protein